MTKAPLSAYLEPQLLDQLETYAARRRVSKSVVAEAAIAAFLSPDSAERDEAVLVRRLDRLTRQVERLERDSTISVEMLALFVRVWLNANPPLPEPGGRSSSIASPALGRGARSMHPPSRAARVRRRWALPPRRQHVAVEAKIGLRPLRPYVTGAQLIAEVGEGGGLVHAPPNATGRLDHQGTPPFLNGIGASRGSSRRYEAARSRSRRTAATVA